MSDRDEATTDQLRQQQRHPQRRLLRVHRDRRPRWGRMNCRIRGPAGGRSLADVRACWDARVHDTELSDDPPGSRGYFAAMASYRYGKLAYMAGVVEFERWRERDVLDIGCGAGLDLVRLAGAGARAAGIDLSGGSLALASRYLAVENVRALLAQADAVRLPFRDESFDLVLCLGVLPFAPDPSGIVAEARRVLRKDGLAILVAYNRHSCMGALRAVSAVASGHGDAPVFRMHTRREFDVLLAPFQRRTVHTERRGWHLVARCRKVDDVTQGVR
jgi:SAM-dependent methyltransferase